MQPVHKYLRVVERGLRCPVERRPALMEEVGAHLRDRVEALRAQGYGESDAERRATREMGPAWLLALRLSAANGWSVTGHVLREVWAAGVATQVAILGSWLGVSVALNSIRFEQAGMATSALHAYDAAAYLTLLVAFAAFGFAVGRLVKGWAWAVIPAIALGSLVRFGLCLGAAVYLVVALVFFGSAVWGSRTEGPKRSWLAWASTALLVACAVGPHYVMPDAVIGGMIAMFIGPAIEHWWRAFYLPDSLAELLALLALPWVSWFAAWLLDRRARGRLAGPASVE